MWFGDPAPRRPLEPWQRWVAGALGATFTGLILVDVVDGYVPAKLSIGFMLLFWVPAIVLHELGHALAARWVDWRVHEFVIGFGPPFARFRVGSTRVTLCTIPLGGYVIPVPRSPEIARLKSALVYFAGPAIQLASAALLTLVVGADLMFSQGGTVAVIAVQSLALVLTIQGVSNLLPHVVRGAPTDGLGILISASLGDEHFRRSAIFPHVAQMETALDAGDAAAAAAAVARGLTLHPDSVELQGLQAVCTAALGQRQEAMASLEALRELPNVSRATESDLLHCAARVVLESGDRSLLGDAETACRASLSLMPDEEVRITLGRLQLEQERYGLATETLMAVYKEVRQPRLEDRCLAYLAVAAHGEGREEDVTLFRDALRKRMPSPQLLDFVDRRVRKSSPAAG